MEIEIEKAKLMWAYLTKTEEDDAILPSHLLELPTVSPPKGGWLEACRKAQMIGFEQAATHAKISKQAYAKFEANEAAGTISLRSLRKAAEAVDCELVYFLRPKKKRSFSTLLWEKLLPRALKTYKARTRLTKGSIKPPVLANIAAELFAEPEVRREMGWVRNEKI